MKASFRKNTKNTKYRNSDADEEEVESVDSFEKTIYKMGNKVYFYEDIYAESILYLKRLIFEVSNELKTVTNKYNLDPVIELHLYSNGGDAFIGLDMFNYIRNNTVQVDTYVDGMIASAATFLYLAGTKRYISDYNHILIHQLSTSFWGKYEDLLDEYNNCKSLMNCIKDLYKMNTKIPKTKLDNLLKRELMLNADDCVKYNVSTDKLD